MLTNLSSKTWSGAKKVTATFKSRREKYKRYSDKVIGTEISKTVIYFIKIDYTYESYLSMFEYICRGVIFVTITST